MPRVPAGNLTGVYYIVVAGLPWACSWQRLKDFARNQQPDGKCIDIDHAMVYPDSTDGWVRVNGRENFLKAFKHLNGGILDDRSLLADGRNETETQTLRDWTTTWNSSAPYRNRNGSSDSSHTYSSSTSASLYSQVAPSPTYSGFETEEWHYQSHQGGPRYASISATSHCISYYQTPSPGYEIDSNPFFTAATVQYSATPPPPTVAYTSSIAPPASIYTSPQSIYTYAVSGPFSGSSYSPTDASHPLPRPPAPPVIKTEARKVIITQLPHSITSSALYELLSKAASSGSKRTSSSSPSRVQSFDIATHANGKSKGHAFAVLETHAIAKVVVKAIDGMKFHGRVLNARLAKEGAEPSLRHSSATEEEHVVLPPVDGVLSDDQAFGLMPHQEEPEDADEVRAGGHTGRVRSESKQRRESKHGAAEKKAGVKGHETVGKRSAAMNTPAVVDGSSSRGSKGKDRKHRS